MIRIAAALVLPVTLLTQVPAGATAKCTDGTYSTATSTKGRCSGHGGVASLVSHKKPASSTATSRTASTSKPRNTAAPTQRAPAAAKTTRTTSSRSTPVTPAAPASNPEASPAATIPTVRAPAGAPAGATAQCKDGTYSTSKVHTGACSRHGGVSQWLQQ